MVPLSMSVGACTEPLPESGATELGMSGTQDTEDVAQTEATSRGGTEMDGADASSGDVLLDLGSSQIPPEAGYCGNGLAAIWRQTEVNGERIRMRDALVGVDVCTGAPFLIISAQPLERETDAGLERQTPWFEAHLVEPLNDGEWYAGTYDAVVRFEDPQLAAPVEVSAAVEFIKPYSPVESTETSVHIRATEDSLHLDVELDVARCDPYEACRKREGE